MTNTISVKAPGRVCFFGDHQDYLGLPVISATIDRYIYIEATPKEDQSLTINFLDLDQQRTIQLEESLDSLTNRDYLRSALRVLKRAGINLQQGFQVNLYGDIPIGAGLSSSSAMVVAWIRFLLKAARPNEYFSDEQIAQWSYAAEVTELNEPGGLMDQYTIALGGMVYLDTNTGAHQRLSVPWESVIIGDSGIKKSTLSVLSQAKKSALEALKIVQEQDPSFRLEAAGKQTYDHSKDLLPSALQPYWFAAIHNHLITLETLSLFKRAKIDMKKVGALMNAHQSILQDQIQNTPLAMVEMIEVARANGAYGAKIVGSGGGGCFVALCSKKEARKVIKALESVGVSRAFLVNINEGSNA